MMDGIRYCIVFSLLLIPVALATSDCPCSLPGNMGYTVGFDCYNRTVENVTLYHSAAVAVGDELKITAGKYHEGDVLTARNLTVEISLNGEPVFSDMTDKEGNVIFAPTRPGVYSITAADYNAEVEAIGEAVETQTMLRLREIIRSLFSIYYAPKV